MGDPPNGRLVVGFMSLFTVWVTQTAGCATENRTYGSGSLQPEKQRRGEDERAQSGNNEPEALRQASVTPGSASPIKHVSTLP